MSTLQTAAPVQSAKEGDSPSPFWDLTGRFLTAASLIVAGGSALEVQGIDSAELAPQAAKMLSTAVANAEERQPGVWEISSAAPLRRIADSFRCQHPELKITAVERLGWEFENSSANVHQAAQTWWGGLSMGARVHARPRCSHDGTVYDEVVGLKLMEVEPSEREVRTAR